MSAAVKELRELNETINQSQIDDEYDLFSKHVAAQLRKLSIEENLTAQQQIQNILTNCRLRDIRKNSRNNSFSSTTPHYFHERPLGVTISELSNYSQDSNLFSPKSTASSSGQDDNTRELNNDLLSQALKNSIGGDYN